MDHERFARTVLVSCAAGAAAASLAVVEAAPILCLAFVTVSEGRAGRLWLGVGTALLGAWLFAGGPWLLAAMGVLFALSLAAPAAQFAPAAAPRAAMAGLAAALPGFAAALAGLAAALAAMVALAAPWATSLADSITLPGAGAAFGLWLGLCTFPLHRKATRCPDRESRKWRGRPDDHERSAASEPRIAPRQKTATLPLRDRKTHPPQSPPATPPSGIENTVHFASEK